MIPTILIVDDSPAIHELVSSYFVDEPWHVCSAYTGVEGLKMAFARGAELILLDLDLPDVNGFDVCRSLRAAPETARSAVIFLTGSSSIDETVCGLQLGASDYITKPFDPAVLLERVRNALRTKRLLDRVPDSPPRNGQPVRLKGERPINHRKMVSNAPASIRATSENPLCGTVIDYTSRAA